MIESSEENRLYKAFDTPQPRPFSLYKQQIIANKSKKRLDKRLPSTHARLMASKSLPTRTARQILYLRVLRRTRPVFASGWRFWAERHQRRSPEVAFQPISWYLTRLETSFAVLIEGGPTPPGIYTSPSALIVEVQLCQVARRRLPYSERISTEAPTTKMYYKADKNAASRRDH